MRSAKPERVVVINDHAVAQGGLAAIALISARLIRARGAPVSPLSRAALAAPALGKRGVSVSILGGRHLLDRSAGSAVTRGTARCVGLTLGRPRSRLSGLSQPLANVAREEAPVSNPRRCWERPGSRTCRRFRSDRGAGGHLSSRSRLRRLAGSARGPAVLRLYREFAVSPPLRVAGDRSAADFPLCDYAAARTGSLVTFVNPAAVKRVDLALQIAGLCPQIPFALVLGCT
jgi:hypothetical protein